VLWSLGNELQQDPNQPFNDFGVTMFRLQKTLLQRYDSTRLVTVAMHPRYRNWETDSLPCDLAMITDVQAYNYRYMYFPGDGRRFPWMTFYQSEASVAAMGENYFAMDRDKVIGMAYWGAIDYLGESQGWPAKGWAQGVFDISLEPKPKAYFMKSFFKPEEPVVHIGIVDKKGDQMWNGVQTGNDGMSDHWNRISGQRLSLYTYTNADEVELLLNGRSLGTKANPRDAKHRNQIRWDDVAYEPGSLEAVARTDGRVVARHRIETTGEATRLTAEADNAGWQADGLDLQHVRLVAVDKKGRRVQTAQGEVSFSVEGDARIVGVINGNINSDEMTVGNVRQLYNGSCTVILRAGRTPGKVTLTAAVPGMKIATVKLMTK
jgi:beta-galactosidase